MHNILGLIPENWTTKKFDEVVELIHGYQFRTTDFTKSGIKVFKITQIKGDGIIDISNCDFIAEERLDNFKKNIINYDDILMALTGATIGKIARFKSKELCLQNYRVGKFITKSKSELSEDYLYYFLSSNLFFNQLLARQTQSAQQNIGKEDINNMTICFPNLTTQTIIAEILYSLDDKIELNNKIKHELETFAQTLFKQWFINFEFPNENGDPYKSSGGEMVESELGKIPKEWQVGTFGDITNKETLKVKKAESTVNKVYSAIKTSELVLSDEYFTKKVYSKSIDNYYVVKKHWFAYNPSRINIGSIGLNKFDIGAVSPVYVVFSVKKYFHFFIENILQLENTKNAIIQRCSGTVRQSLNFEGLSSIPLKIPNDKLVIMFNDFVENNSEHISLIAKETQKLINLRDSLLPKLISGELSINETTN
jgi:type I restriction enzyme S subunit